MSIKLFITGTDTDCGKTYISVGLLNAYQQLGFSTLGLKPLATGCDPINSDVALLQAASTIKLATEMINPISFEPPIAPNIAAQLVGESLSVDILMKATEPAFAQTADVMIIEGAGGSHIPLNNTETLADWVAEQQLPTILVVALRLGCLHQAITTLRALLADNVPVIGWIGNCVNDTMLAKEENIQTLKSILSVPCLGIVEPQQTLSHLLLPTPA